MTVFALLAATLQADASRRLWVPGTFADEKKLSALDFVKGKFEICQNVSFVFTIIGTMIWGYGDVFLAGAVRAICLS